MNRIALLGTLLLVAACARNGQPGFTPVPEARKGQIELDPQEATKKLAEAMTAAGLPVAEVATRDGFVSTSWYDTVTMKRVGSRPLGPAEVRIRAWVMPWKYGWSEITMEAVYRPLADPSLPARELERSVPFGHPARVKIREIMQQMGVTSTLAESDAPQPELKAPIMDPGRLDKTGGKLKPIADSSAKPAPGQIHQDSVAAAATDTTRVIPADTLKPTKDSVPVRRDSAIIFRPQVPGDTVLRRPPPDSVAAPKPKPPAPVAPQPATGFSVQVVATPDTDVATEYARRLRALGYSARTVLEDGRYKVRTQLYPARPDAAIALERLRATFRDAFLVGK